ncbi:MAG: ATPase with DUF4143 domain [Algoriphagus marincola HL-49]|uniref:ATPase with DUF4143 domain n=1 Tax=Algoriphagus marincola HL-49 TaxID=1305737 RepID=A0A0P7XEF3_9BACT|nr:MAG: ATPase with DUF4143 domain [Algoriphagus marincola HL-49]
MHIDRKIFEKLFSKFGSGKATILLGPRQVGKTTLVKKLAETQGEFLYLNADEPSVISSLSRPSLPFLKAYLSNSKTVVIDEAQRIPDIGITLKLIIDNFQDLNLIVTGSSSLELANQIHEPLTGRKWEFQLFPFSWAELIQAFGFPHMISALEKHLVFGSYPEVVTNSGNEIEILKNLASSYLYKDLLNFQGIRKPELLHKILQALAWQMGSEVSMNELGRTVQADKNTVSNYLDLLEKAFIVFRLQPFSRNLRSEISSSRKYYFIDNGIRNSVIGNYSALGNRQDIGPIWENFLISERVKLLSYNGFHGKNYFWRLARGGEIDYIEEIDGQLYPFEFKWNPKAKVRTPKAFIENYKSAPVQVIHRENFMEWLSEYPY